MASGRQLSPAPRDVHAACVSSVFQVLQAIGMHAPYIHRILYRRENHLLNKSDCRRYFWMCFFYYFCVMFSLSAPDSWRGSQRVHVYFCMNVQCVEPGTARVFFRPSGLGTQTRSLKETPAEVVRCRFDRVRVTHTCITHGKIASPLHGIIVFWDKRFICFFQSF